MDSRLEQRLAAIEARLAKLEGKPVADEVPAYMRRHQEVVKERTIKARDVATNGGIALNSSNWLAIIAVICFIFASGLIIKLAITSGWLTQVRQVGLSYLLGAGLILTGLKLLDQEKYYASYLPSAGVIILYATTFAAHRVYMLFPFLEAMIITAVISCLTILLYYKIRHDIYLIISAIGTYAAPIILNYDAPNYLFAPYFYIICSLAFATISIALSSRLLCMISAYAAILATSIVAVDSGQQKLIAGVLILHFVIFSVATFLYSIVHRTELSRHDAWCYFPVLILFYIVEYALLSDINSRFAPWISLDFAGFMLILMSLALLRRNWKPLPSASMIVSFICIVLFHAGYIELLPDFLHAWLVLAIFSVYTALSPKQKSVVQFNDYFIPIGLVLTIAVIEYTQTLFSLATDNHYELTTILSAFALYATFWVVCIGLGYLKKNASEMTEVLLCFMHILAIATLYQLFNPMNALAVSASWLFYALAIFFIANYLKNYTVAKSAILILSISAFKALLIDASSAPTLIRILCLLVTGVVLYYCGMLLKHFARWKE